ncbi:MAG: hypothetical protein MUE83_11295 [Tabrizicola sp.]|jgi:hypothetical protein|nr:hypothetical protein [Tabrizicola sp.]
MSRLILALTLVPALCLPAMAEAWLTPKAFEALVAGKVTRVLNLDGTPFGTEYFGADRTVIWQYAGESQCLTGRWTPRQGAVCYAYDEGTENCMRYRPDGNRLIGVDANPGGSLGDPVVLVVTDAAPPACVGS